MDATDYTYKISIVGGNSITDIVIISYLFPPDGDTMPGIMQRA